MPNEFLATKTERSV